MNEQYATIKGFDKYQISTFGNILNKKRNKILKPALDKDGYCVVGLYNNYKKYCLLKVHRLLALAFIDNPENKQKVDHIDINPLNNNLSNLRWATPAEQQQNRKKQANCSSHYKGVSFKKKNNKWEASIKINYKTIYLGQFQTEQEAAQKYNDYIIDNKMTEFSVLNKF